MIKFKNTFAFLVGLPLAVTAADSAFAAKPYEVTGVASCIMNSSGVAGDVTAPIKESKFVREPASGDYMDNYTANIFKNGKTLWVQDIYARNKSGQVVSSTHYVQWGFYPSIKDRLDAEAGGTPANMLWLYSAYPGQNIWWTHPADFNTFPYVPKYPTQVLGNDGFTYYRGAYYGLKNDLLVAWDLDAVVKSAVLQGRQQGNLYGIYRQGMLNVDVAGSGKFYECSASDNSSLNWIGGSYVTASEINNSFKEFEDYIIKQINQKKLNLNLITEFADVIENASAGAKISFDTKSFSGVGISSDVSDVLGSNSDDSTSFGAAFRN